LAAGISPDPLEEVKRSLNSLAAIRGPTSKGSRRRGGEAGALHMTSLHDAP